MFKYVWVSTGFALVLLAVGVITGSSTLLARVDLLHKVPPICLPLDLSTQGVYSGHYKRSYAAILDDQLRLFIVGDPSVEKTRELLEGLTALMVLRDDSGEVVSEQVIDSSDFHQWNARNNSGLVITLPLEKVKHQAGRYYLSIEVKKPAKSMAGNPHCLVAELGLSNVECIGAYVVGIPVGCIMLLLGIIMLASSPKNLSPPNRKSVGQVRRT